MLLGVYPKELKTYVNTKTKLLGLINKFSDISVYKINTHKILHFYTLIMNYHQKEKIRKKNPIYNEIIKNKIPRNKFKEVKDVYIEN